MKKNLRIVSAAAAALLAVAPIAASAVSTVSADAINVFTTKPATVNDKDAISVSAHINAVTKPGTLTTNTSTGVTTPSDFNSSVNGTITTTLNGQSYTANLAAGTSATIYHVNNGKLTKVNPDKLVPGTHYYAFIPDVSFNFGSNNANKTDLALKGANGLLFQTKGSVIPGNVNNATVKEYFADNMKVNTDKNGVTTNATISVLAPFTATDTTNMRSVSFFERANGAEVSNGTLDVNANSNAQLNVNAVVAAFNAKYSAHQFVGGNQYTKANVTTTVKDIEDQLKKQNITVDANGNFEAPKTLNLTFNAKSIENGYTASMPVVVNVQNGKEATAAQEVTKNVTIMHIATIYDKNGKATTEPVLRAYNSQAVVSEPVTINGAKFYKLAGKDQYIKVGNVDGTKRTLKHNSYVYKSNGKAYTHKVGKKTKKVLKKSGSEVTTYGKSFMIHGSQMWRIGKNQYIKVRNF